MIAALLCATSALVVKQPTTTVPAPVLKLRGGLAGLDGNQVATYASWLLAANSAVMTLAPEKAVEMYGVKSSSLVVSQFVEYAGSSMLSIAIASILALGGMDFTTAVAWGFVPQCVLNVQGFLNEKMTKMGFGQAAKFMPTIVSLVLTAGLFGKLSFLDTAMALKITAGWSAINGLGGYFATADFMKAWEGPTMTPVETAMAKFFCGTLIMGGVFAGSVAFLDSDVLTAIGHTWAASLATQLDANFISKTTEIIGADKNPQYAWMAVMAVVAGSILA
jgi:hypothetical protein